MDVTLRQLEYVVAVARHRHFGRAAEAAHATQPALSAGLAQIEAAIGVRLFERGRGGVRTTGAGEEIVRRAEEVLARVEDLRGAARAARGPFSTPMRCGVIPTVAPYVLPTAVPALRAELPALRLVLREDRTARLVEALAHGTLDVALLALEADLGDCETIPLWRDPFLVALPPGHRLARGTSVSERDLRDERILLLEEGHCLRTQVRTVCDRLRMPEAEDLRATSLTTLVHMTAGGLGVTILPAIALTGAMAAGIRALPFRESAPYRTICLAFRAATIRRAEIQAVADLLRRHVPPGTTAIGGVTTPGPRRRRGAADRG